MICSLVRLPKSSLKCINPKIFRRRRCFGSKSDNLPLADVFLEYDPSPLHLIHTMLDKADLKAHETFLDLYVQQFDVSGSPILILIS